MPRWARERRRDGESPTLGAPKLRCLDRPVAVSLEALVPPDHNSRFKPRRIRVLPSSCLQPTPGRASSAGRKPVRTSVAEPRAVTMCLNRTSGAGQRG